MKYLYSWLKEYYQTDDTVSETGLNLISLGSEVEETVSFPQIDENIIVVKIIKIDEHPNADKLKLPTVTDGTKEITLVCGAPNIEVGQVVAMARVGCRVRDFVIEEAEIRGVKSPGMLCSPRELDLSDDHRGVYILPAETRLGEKVADVLSEDHVLDLEITPNRGDLLSHFGLARDLSALKGVSLKRDGVKLSESDEKAEEAISVTIHSQNCPLYLARVIRGVQIAESPDWLKKRLIAVGAKPINNVVDITNYIMLDLGQPLHAFDMSKLSGSKIEVRDIVEDMDVVTLDGEARTLLSGMVAICDDKRPVAIAGVMGLKNSEVDEQTADIVIEAAVFDRKSIRKTAKLLNLKTEASARYERGVDDQSTQYAVDKAAKLIQEVAGGQILQDSVVSGEIRKQADVMIEYDKINQYADLNLSNTEIDKILENLGFILRDGKVTVPSWRHDIEIWQDLAEEVYRINGLKKIKAKALGEAISGARGSYYKAETIKDYLVESGLDEAINYTFLSDLDVEAAQIEASNLVEVANPVQEENRYLRNSLIPGLLKSVSRNPSFDDIEIFEIGRVFEGQKEWTSFAIVTSGKQSRKASKIVELICGKFNLSADSFKTYEIGSEDLKRFKIKKPIVSVAEVNLDEILSRGKFEDSKLVIHESETQYRPISKFPPVKRDLAFIIDKKINSGEIRKSILENAPKVVLAELFDEFESEKLGIGMKSVAFHVWLEDMEKTLSDSEADEQISKIISELKEKFGAEIRS